MTINIITLDGVAGAGKTTIAKKLSKKLSARVLFSGQLYRAVAYEVIVQKIAPTNMKKIIKIAKSLDMSIYKEKMLYSEQIDLISSKISSNISLRKALIHLQRNFPKIQKKTLKWVIVEGRDIGTVIFPKAKYKFFMFASPEIRAKRRLKQVKKSSKKANFNYILKQIKARDMRDMTRSVAPGLPAADCHLIDNTNYDIPQTFNTILKIIRAKK